MSKLEKKNNTILTRIFPYYIFTYCSEVLVFGAFGNQIQASLPATETITLNLTVNKTKLLKTCEVTPAIQLSPDANCNVSP